MTSLRIAVFFSFIIEIGKTLYLIQRDRRKQCFLKNIKLCGTLNTRFWEKKGCSFGYNILDLRELDLAHYQLFFILFASQLVRLWYRTPRPPPSFFFTWKHFKILTTRHHSSSVGAFVRNPRNDALSIFLITNIYYFTIFSNVIQKQRTLVLIL